MNRTYCHLTTSAQYSPVSHVLSSPAILANIESKSARVKVFTLSELSIYSVRLSANL